uniref:G6b-B extracellular V-set Ig-like domain-containing protein n=1 Tax=Vombatus ursinus TaxID=29139 RepID=A0A4X2K1L6_VOMUR
MVPALQLLLLLSGTGGNLGVFLEGRPGDRVNISCTGVSHATRWAWAPSFPACVGLLRGRRPVFWASAPGNPTPASTSPFTGRLRALDPNGIQQLELLLARGDSGTFFCTGIGGRRDNESRTSLKVLGDLAACRTPSSTSAPPVNTEIQSRSKEEPRERGDLDVERSLLYADLDHIPLRNPRWLRTTVPKDAATIYAVVV